jgi:hypothetical protein
MERIVSLRVIFIFIGLLFLLTFLIAIFVSFKYSIGTTNENAEEKTSFENGEQTIQLSGETEDFSGSSDDEESSGEFGAISGGVVSGDEGSGSEGQSPLSPRCRNNSISYFIGHFVKSSVCNQYSGEICMDRTLDCSVTASNLDEEISGIFEIEFAVFGGETPIEPYVDSRVLGPGESAAFSGSFHVQGEEADDSLDCDFSTKTIPSIETCSI